MSSYLENTSSIQIELSSKCNHLCPSCIRTDFKTLRHTNPLLEVGQEMPMETITKVIESQFFKERVLEVEFCGTVDEPFAHTKFLQILKSFVNEKPEIKISIHTNGSLQNPEYYQELAQVLVRTSPESVVRFSIDGIGETHSIYRFGGNYEKVITNLKAFIDKGGRAIWQTVVFPWNENQIEEMEQIAKTLGCVGFFARPDRTNASKWGEEKIKSLRYDKSTLQSKPSTGDQDYLDGIFNSLTNKTSCVYKDTRKMFFISWDSRIWPCCFWSNIRYENLIKREALEATLFEKYETNFNSINDFEVDQILSHSFLNNDLIDAWRNDKPLKWRCVEKCSLKKVRTSDGEVDDKKHLKQSYFNKI